MTGRKQEDTITSKQIYIASVLLAGYDKPQHFPIWVIADNANEALEKAREKAQALSLESTFDIVMGRSGLELTQGEQCHESQVRLVR